MLSRPGAESAPFPHESIFGARCFACGAMDFVAFAKTPPGSWVRCRGCHLVRQEQPPPQEVSQGRYGFSLRHGEAAPQSWGLERVPEHLGFKYWIVGRALASRGLSGRLVDVGCGSGLLQHDLLSLGWKASVGVEPSGNPTGREKLGLEIYNEPVESFLRRPGMAGGFDVAVANHVLEHCYDPPLLLRQLRELLRPGGHALIATPNIAGASMRWKTLVSRLGAKARPFRHLDYPKHLVLFEPGNLLRLTREAGLEGAVVETYTRASSDAAAHRRLKLWDRLGLGDNMFVVARRPAP